MKISAINNTNNYQNKSFQAKFARSESLISAFDAALLYHYSPREMWHCESSTKALSESFLLAVKSLLENGSEEKIKVHVPKGSEYRGERVMKRVISIARKRNSEFDSSKIERYDGVLYCKDTLTPEELSAITPEIDQLTQLDKTSPDLLSRLNLINLDIKTKLNDIYAKNLIALRDKIFNK